MKASNILVILFLLLTAKYHAQIKKDTILQTIDVFQNDMNNEYADSTHSPLTKEDRLKFKGHDFYPINMNLVVVANLKVTPGQEIFEMPTTTERKPKYVKYGEITFKVKRKKYKLNVYQSMDLLNKPEYKDYLFLPFKDLTSGTTSYGGGSYIDLNLTDVILIMVAFNMGYNPYCYHNQKHH